MFDEEKSVGAHGIPDEVRRTVERWFQEFVDDVYGFAARRLSPAVGGDVTSETFRIARVDGRLPPLLEVWQSESVAGAGDGVDCRSWAPAEEAVQDAENCRGPHRSVRSSSAVDP